MKVTPIGAARTVTGSMYLIEFNGHKLLLDSGLFQGEKHIEELNESPFPFDPREIEKIIITHGHLDHIGMLPRLVREGFEGEIISTAATRDIAGIMLLDAAHLQEEEARASKKRYERRGIEPREPLYTVEDALLTMGLFRKTLKYGEEAELYPDLKIVFRDAGHILGSAFVEMRAREKGRELKITFSGDLGNVNKPIVRDPESPKLKDSDYLFIESTYGDREHKSVEESVRELKEAVLNTLERGGNAVIPTFALERAQDILYYFREMVETGELSNLNVFLDSPLAISATRIFRAHPECYDDEARELLKRHKDPFTFPGVHFTRSVEASRAINNIKRGAIIMAGSGMCTGGRVKHHLKHNLWRKECSVIFVGYQTKGTLGRKIVDGAKEVEIYGELISVNAEIYTINGFSAHAGRDTLLDWASHFHRDTTIFTMHGEESSIEALGRSLSELGYKTHAPQRLETLEL
ncbi:MAG: MBL fold metallo-hydrolase [Candidatus Hydrothermota bacterium]|nr:MAG: MBL fold metallo-hydrolase [Candidatus Hydrothermae bacterium]